MEQKTQKEQWIDDIMNSTAGMAKAAPAEGLHSRVMAFAAGPARTGNTVAIPAARWVAAAILLLALNIGTAIHSSRQAASHKQEAGSNPFAAAIQAETFYNY